MEIVIKTQKEFDALPAKFDQYTVIVIKNDPTLGRIFVGIARENSSVEAWENSSVVARENSSVVARENSSVEAWENSSVVARENSSVVAWGNSSVVAWGNSSVEAWENSSVVARGNSSVVARENSSVVARGNSSVEAWGNSSVVARENSSVVAWGNSSVVAWGNSSVVAWGNSSVVARGNSSVVAWGNAGVHLNSVNSSVILYMFAVCWVLVKGSVKKKSKTATIIQPKKSIGTNGWLDGQGVKKNGTNVVLFKRVSSELKTQENTLNETIWEIGKILENFSWSPENEECGAGKFHACSQPYFCDEFRSKKGDKYVAIQIAVKDLYAWSGENVQYPHKIAFRRGKVLYCCDKHGNKVD